MRQLVLIGMRNLIFTCYVLCRTEVSSKIKYINQTRKTLHLRLEFSILILF